MRLADQFKPAKTGEPLQSGPKTAERNEDTMYVATIFLIMVSLMVMMIIEKMLMITAVVV